MIRQITHDVRNGLSAIDLEAAFIGELVDDPEATDEVRKLRGMVANSARMLRELSQNFQNITLHELPWGAATFFQELETRLRHQFPGEMNFSVTADLGAEQIEVDLEQTVAAVTAIVENAFHFREDGAPVTLAGKIEGDRFVMELTERKSSLESEVPPSEWGMEPFKGTRHGGYGLGLFRARRLIEAHGGALEISFNGEALISRVILPLYVE